MKVDIAQLVLYEDNHLLVLNKPAGLLVHGDATGDITLLDQAKTYLKLKYHKPGNVYLHALHRLDRPVSGVILMARTEKALKRLQISMKNREINKEYVALSDALPQNLSGRLIDYLAKNAKLNKAYVTTKKDLKAKKSILTYEVLGNNNMGSLISINLETGRPHQIRIQLSHMKCAIIGDKKYGSRVKIGGRIMLHARSLSLLHPVKKEPIRITAAVPDFWKESKYYKELADLVTN